MGRILISPGGGGGTSSDELTATKAQVLEGYTAVTKDSDDEAGSGTMQNLTDRASIQYESGNSTKVIAGDAVFKAKNTDNTDRICIRYNGNAGYITPNTLFAFPSSNFGTVVAANVLSGQTFTSSNGIKLSGTMPDNSTRTSNGSVPGISSSYSNAPTREGSNLQLNTDTNGVARISIGVPRGYYPDPGSSYINRPASDFGTVAASNVRSGQTFTSTAGIKVTGTMSVQSAISFSAAATSYNTIRISWNNPPKGPWQGVFIQMSTGGYPGTGGGSRVYTGRGNSSSANASNYVDITGLNANTTYYFTCTSYVDNLGWGTSYNVNATTKQATISEILGQFINLNSTYISYEYSEVFNEDDGPEYVHGDRRITSISGEYLYTDWNNHYTSSNSSTPSKLFYFYDLKSRPSSSVISALNTYCNRLWIRYRNREGAAWQISYRGHYGKTGSGYGYTPANITFAEGYGSNALRVMISLGNKNAFFEEGNTFYQLQFFKG